MTDSAPLASPGARFAEFLIANPDYKPLVSSTALYRAIKTVDMGPAPPTTLAGTFRMLLRFTGPDAALAENVYYGSSSAYVGTQQQVNTAASALASQAIGGNGYLSLISPHWQLDSAIVQDNSGTGNFAQVVINTPGLDTATGNALPPNVAAVISWDVDKRYKGGHPRTYVPGIQEANVDTPGGKNWTAGFTGALKSAGKTFLDNLAAALALQFAGATVGTLSRRTNYTWRTPPVFWQFFDSKSHPRVDTQRRRLGKELTSG